MHIWPEHERPREKLISKGATSLTDAELLAIFLRTGFAGKPVLRLAQDLLEKFSDVQGVLASSQSEFCAIKGLGLAKFVQLQAAFELVKRSINNTMMEQQAFIDPVQVKNFLLANFEQTSHERFACVFLNSKNRLIKFEYLFNGSINSAQVYPRTVAQQCLKFNAAAVIFAHNHPSGDVKPSQADQKLTQNLIKTLKLIDVRVLDHFVIGFNDSYSMAENGMM